MDTAKIPLIEKEVSIMKESLNTLAQDFKEHRIEWRQSMERMEEKYAGKWTEKLLIFIWSVIWTAIVGTLMAMILK